MKRPFLLSLITLIALTGIWLLWSRRASISQRPSIRSPLVQHGSDTIAELTPQAATGAVSTSTLSFPSKSARGKLSQKERIAWLEKMGAVPEDAENLDWQLAQRTSWWGKRLDAKEFWKNRVGWFDQAAKLAAQRRGRFYPPIPSNADVGFLNGISDKDYPPGNLGGLDSLNIQFLHSHAEAAYWNKIYFSADQPKPPEQLEQRQLRAAELIFGRRYDADQPANPSRLRAQDLSQMERSEKADAGKTGYPNEAFTDEALFWAYVLKSRREYSSLSESGTQANSLAIKLFLRRLVVEAKYITEPLSDQQLRAGNAWKIAYVQRLGREKVDDSYINAYLQAWNLSRNEVFAAPEGP